MPMMDATTGGEKTMSTADTYPAGQAPPEETSLIHNPTAQNIQDQLRHYEEALADFNDRAQIFIREHPGVCIAGALALGYLVGRAASRRWLR